MIAIYATARSAERCLLAPYGMPELPEVETIRRQLEPQLVGARLSGTWAFDSPKFLDAMLVEDQEVEALDRRGKYLITRLSSDIDLIIHLGMTGKVRVAPAGDPHDPYSRARWRVDDDRILSFDDVRRFGRIAVTTRDDHRALTTLHHLGPEPFDPTLDDERFWRSLRSTRRHIKTDLLSQRPIAGVGNIYADEALWRAGVHPADRTITRSKAYDLLDALRAVLAEGIEHGGTTLRDYVDAQGATGSHQHHLACYGRYDEPCERCGATLRRTVLDARTTTFCPSCQPRRR
ncbi:MAG: bifunctional DNA-formamidopyrimidine glycosylase/DNA-(apurinic or apyrimidinic site) lyase [Microthrixaceae bacterium]